MVGVVLVGAAVLALLRLAPAVPAAGEFCGAHRADYRHRRRGALRSRRPATSCRALRPGAGFWLLTLAFALMASDAVARLQLRPLAAHRPARWRSRWRWRSSSGSGLWNDLSVLREYANRADGFWREAETHVMLALGSLAAATVVGIPLGIFCHRVPRLRAAILNVLNARADHSLDRAVRPADRAARLGCRQRARRGGHRHCGHRRRAGHAGAVSLFAAAGGGQHGRRARRRAARRGGGGARHGHDRSAAPASDRAAAGLSGRSSRASASSSSRTSGSRPSPR